MHLRTDNWDQLVDAELAASFALADDISDPVNDDQYESLVAGGDMQQLHIEFDDEGTQKNCNIK
jgi:hypothetical protein